MTIYNITFTGGGGSPPIAVGDVARYSISPDDDSLGTVTALTGTQTAGTLTADFDNGPPVLPSRTTIVRDAGGWTATMTSFVEVGSSGTLAVTLDSSTLAASGTTTVTGTLAVTLADSTLAASGDAGSGGSTGTLAVTLAASTLAAAGDTTVTGTLAVTLDASTLAAAGDAGALPAADTTASTGSNWARMISTEPPRGIDDELEAVLASLLLLT